MGNGEPKLSGSAAPIIALLRRNEEWIGNKELAAALGFVNARGNKSVVGHWKETGDQSFREGETKLIEPEGDRFGRRRAARVFSKSGVIRAALRARTENARLFQDWVVDQLVGGEVWNG